MTSASLTSAQTRFLRGQAHELKALMQIGGKGVSDGVIAELNQLLEDHELVKVKVGAADRESRDAMIQQLAERTDAALVQRIGHTAVLYRPSQDKRHIVLPRA
ncbi:MAG: ribosome assembly RNA-binding protein YhbY [Xanthomonadaceae bacterium]|nr:ribosome assembly RNA-binding protein YhbY [Xanthomonadaceae bacterium]